MTISSVAANAPSVQPNAQNNAVRQNFQQLSQALQSGDLSDAQAAYSTLMQSLPNQGQSTNGSSNNPFQQAIASIGSSLQSGDISGAQQALSAMQTQMKGAHHHHHHASSTSQNTDTSNPNSDSDSDTITPAALPPTASMSLYA